MARKRGPDKPGTSSNRFTDRRKEIYLAELRRTGRKLSARLAANISQTTVNTHRTKYPEFLEGEEMAFAAFYLLVEDEIQRRAIEGVAKPVFQGGEEVGSIREYDSRLLIELARSHMDQYKPHVTVDQRTEHSGGLALEADLSKLDARGRALLRELLQCEIKDDDVPEEEIEADE